MIITLVIILLLIGAAVVASIYSNFMVFYSNFNESENYHKAYYNAISALERAELVTKQREPGFDGDGGWRRGEPDSQNSKSDGKIGNNFSYLSSDDYRNAITSVYWTIKSRTSRIPAEGEGDVELMLATGDSKDYNMMDYEDTQVFLLYYDNFVIDKPYTKTSCANGGCAQTSTSVITGVIRLPSKLKPTFGLLDTNHALIGNGPKDDPIVDWQIRGKYKNDAKFTIYATQSYSYSDVKNAQDNAIRESDINDINRDSELNFQFGGGTNKKTPLENSSSRGNNAEFTIISQKENDVKRDATNFSTIFDDSTKFTDKQLRFSLLNLLQASSSGMVYPFLEYYIDFGSGNFVSDKYFTINAEGNYDDYKINKIIWKPTSKESVLGSFTTIF